MDTSWQPAAVAMPCTRAMTGCGNLRELQHHPRAGVEQLALPRRGRGARAFPSGRGRRRRRGPRRPARRRGRAASPAAASSAAVERRDHRGRQRVEPVAAVQRERADAVARVGDHQRVESCVDRCVHHRLAGVRSGSHHSRTLRGVRRHRACRRGRINGRQCTMNWRRIDIFDYDFVYSKYVSLPTSNLLVGSPMNTIRLPGLRRFRRGRPRRTARPDRRRLPPRRSRARVAALLAEAHLAAPALQATQDVARRLAEGVRAERHKAGGVDALMLEFSLDSREGIALMCLAEALLRIPDAATRDRLIRDKIGQGDWRAHVGRSPSLFVNAAAWGLLVTGRLVDSRSDGALEQALASLLRKGGEPLIRKGVDLAMRLLGRSSCIGRTIDEALGNARERAGARLPLLVRHAGRGGADRRRCAALLRRLRARDPRDRPRPRRAPASTRGTGHLDQAVGAASALLPRAARARARGTAAARASRWRSCAKASTSASTSTPRKPTASTSRSTSWPRSPPIRRSPDGTGSGFVVQAYQKRARAIGRLGDRARAPPSPAAHGAPRQGRVLGRRGEARAGGRHGRLPGVHAQGAHGRRLPRVRAGDAASAGDALYPQFASHNAYTIAAIHALAGDAEFEFQCLHGMGESVYDLVTGAGHLDRPCRIYAPVGSHETLLAYLVRRLLENGANTSFVNRIVDPARTDRRPDRGSRRARAPPAARRIRAFPARSPSIRTGRIHAGWIFRTSRRCARSSNWSPRERRTRRRRCSANPTGRARSRRAIANPSDPADVVGEVEEADAGEVAAAVGERDERRRRVVAARSVGAGRRAGARGRPDRGGARRAARARRA